MDESRLAEIEEKRQASSYIGFNEEVGELITALRQAWRERDEETHWRHLLENEIAALVVSKNNLLARADRAEASLNQLREAAEKHRNAELAFAKMATGASWVMYREIEDRPPIKETYVAMLVAREELDRTLERLRPGPRAMTTFRIEPTETLLLEIRNRSATKDNVADSYYLAMHYRHADTDWATVNAAILARWSASGLRYIKRRAWKLLEHATKEVPDALA